VGRRSRREAKVIRVVRAVIVACGALLFVLGAIQVVEGRDDRPFEFVAGLGLGLIAYAVWIFPKQFRPKA
jgi:hypothetical protein